MVDYFTPAYEVFNAFWDIMVGILNFFSFDLFILAEEVCSWFGFSVDIPLTLTLNDIIFDTGLFYLVIAVGIVAFIVTSAKNIIF